MNSRRPVNSNVGPFTANKGAREQVSHGNKLMKCDQCGLVNLKTASACKRCGAPLTADSAPVSTDNLTTAWRDSALLVMTLHSVLPMRCLRCNVDSGVAQRTVAIHYYPASSLAYYLAGVLSYTRFRLKLPLCRKHNLSRALSIVLGMFIIFAGISIVVAGFGLDSGILLYGGFPVIIAGFVVAAVKGGPLSVRKMRSPYFWLSGIDKSYLAPLPPWTK